jgi:hypothetical protein
LAGGATWATTLESKICRGALRPIDTAPLRRASKRRSARIARRLDRLVTAT